MFVVPNEWLNVFHIQENGRKKRIQNMKLKNLKLNAMFSGHKNQPKLFGRKIELCLLCSRMDAKMSPYTDRFW